MLLLVVIAAGATAPASARRPQGVNISHAQREIDWRLVHRRSRIEFVFVRASRGLDGMDRYYRRNYEGASKAGLRVGAYHRAFPLDGTPREQQKDAFAEAGKFVKSVRKLHAGDLLPVLDVEPPFDGLTAAELERWCRLWLRRVGRKFDVKPMIYTNPAIWDVDLANSKYFAQHGYRLWISQRDVPKPRPPANDWAKRSWTFWQKSIGNVQGIPGQINKNAYRLRGFGAVTARHGTKRYR